jgi:hypothetical protein
MDTNDTRPRWALVVKPQQEELFEVLRQRLEGSGVEVIVDRRSRERRRGSLGPAMDRRVTDRRRQRSLALVSMASSLEAAVTPTASTPSARPSNVAVMQSCPTCLESVELKLPRFPHPPARVEIEIRHVAANGRDGHHYVEIAAFTVSGRLILSQRVPARRIA